MRLVVNGAWLECQAEDLAALLDQLGYTHGSVATAVNGEFVQRTARTDVLLQDGMQVDIVAPIQGG